MAFLWLYQQTVAEGIAAVPGQAEADPVLTAAAAETVANLGLPHVARHWLNWLASLQRDNGSLCIPSGESALATAWYVRACLAVDPEEPGRLRSFHTAVEWLVDFVGQRSAAAGATLRIDRAHPTGAGTADPLQPHWPTGYLEAAAAICRAAERFEHPGWRAAVAEVIERIGASSAPAHWAGAFDRRAAWGESLLELGCCEAAASVLLPTRAAQRSSGVVPMAPDATCVASATLAHLAACWYRLGWRGEADRIMAWLQARQRRSGAFPVGWSHDGLPTTHDDPWTAKRYLDAIQLQVQMAFDATGDQLPDTIDPNDGRVEAVRLWAAKLPHGAAVADVGCGKGRFLRHLACWDESFRLVGVDPSPALLACLPHSVAPCEGRLTRIPLATDSLDGVLAVESLEHALLPQAAVGELCRVVRPGGRVLIVEKDRRSQALSQHDPWEQWLSPHQLTDWLEHFCGEVSVSRVCHLEGRGGSRLFFAIRGVKRPG